MVGGGVAKSSGSTKGGGRAKMYGGYAKMYGGYTDTLIIIIIWMLVNSYFGLATPLSVRCLA